MVELIPLQLRTSTACSILAGMESDRDFSRIPLLLDALFDAGATPADCLHFFRIQLLLDPANDEPRLRWAEAVANAGEPLLGEFVRTQIDLWNLELGDGANHVRCVASVEQAATCTCNLHHLKRRERELWRSLGEAFPAFRGAMRGEIPEYSSSGMVFRVLRGFITTVTCPWSEWMRYEQDLFWWPEAQDECMNCRGRGMFSPDWPCPDCGGRFKPRNHPNDLGYSPGTGHVQRPFVTSAQPLDTVFLSSFPQYERQSNGDLLVPDADIAFKPSWTDIDGEPVPLLSTARWPGIAFEVPFDLPRH